MNHKKKLILKNLLKKIEQDMHVYSVFTILLAVTFGAAKGAEYEHWTDCQESGGPDHQSIAYFDRHNVYCEPGQALTSFHVKYCGAEMSPGEPDPLHIQIQYKCADVGGRYPQTARDAFTGSTSCQDEESLEYLDRYGFESGCSGRLLGAFRFETAECSSSQQILRYKCPMLEGPQQSYLSCETYSTKCELVREQPLFWLYMHGVYCPCKSSSFVLS
jgi:hypothetical protein